MEIIASLDIHNYHSLVHSDITTFLSLVLLDWSKVPRTPDYFLHVVVSLTRYSSNKHRTFYTSAACRLFPRRQH